MSFMHYLFVGHFDHEEGLVRFSKDPSSPVYKPVVSRPLDMSEVNAVLRATQGVEGNGMAFPSDWQIWLEDGFLICDKYSRNRDEVRFVMRLVERTGCEIFDASAHENISLAEWSSLALGLPNRDDAAPIR